MTFFERTNWSFIKDELKIPPINTIDGCEAWWRRRRDMWKALGFKSELGRDDNLLKFSKVANEYAVSGTSIFDPVLCELSYRWYCARGGTILDPFSGGSVRGLVATLLGYNY